MPSRNRPSAQPMTEPRCRRQASPTGEPSARDALARPGRGGRSPAAKSRRSSKATATATSSAVAVRGSSSGHQRSPA